MVAVMIASATAAAIIVLVHDARAQGEASKYEEG
jgi:hypothetical protein